MPTLMLRPNWPSGRFSRTVTIGKRKPKRLTFLSNTPVEVTTEERRELEPDIGNAIFDVELDDKGRARFVEVEADIPELVTNDANAG